MVQEVISFFNTPMLHHSSTPWPRLSQTSGILKIPFLLAIVPQINLIYFHTIIYYNLSNLRT